jgi:predicted Zn finger-like uncharacterized protein
MFKVVPDQIRISDGWVRCGHCAEVFDAPAHWVDEAALMSAPDAPTPSDGPVPASASDAVEALAPRVSLSAVDDGGARLLSDVPAMSEASATDDQAHAIGAADVDDMEAADVDGAAATPLPEPPTELPLDLSELPSLDLAAADVEPVSAAREPSDTRIESGAVVTAVDASPEHVEASPEVLPTAQSTEDTPAVVPSFVRQADRRAFWRRPAVRILLGLLLLLSIAALGAQWIYVERDRIAAQWPQTRPALEQMCELAGCEVSALRRIDAVVIDGSSFTRLRADAYRLGIVLKNTATLDIAMPSIELTLTDTQDQTVVRRVLSPADLGAGALLGAGAEWNGNVPLALDATQGPRVAGYRVLAFYP